MPALIILSFSNCSFKHVAGKYVDTIYGDTLYLYSDSTYEYLEKLNKGNIGSTNGTWSISGKKVLFESEKKPLVGYSLTSRIDASGNGLSVALVEELTNEPIYIEEVQLFTRGSRLKEAAFIKKGNRVQVLNPEADSIVLHSYHFENIILSKFNSQGAYTLSVLPVERLYELDKVPFKYSAKTLKSTQTEQYFNIFLTFKKEKR